MKAFRSNKFDITPSKQIIKEGTNSYFNWKQQLEPLLSAIPNQCECQFEINTILRFGALIIPHSLHKRILKIVL
jgi:hypothetical protein